MYKKKRNQENKKEIERGVGREGKRKREQERTGERGQGGRQKEGEKEATENWTLVTAL